MRIITYFAFTLLSILIQFSVMDFIQNKKVEIANNDVPVSLNGTTPKMHFTDILKHFTQKPYALYYRTKKIFKENNTLPYRQIYSNSSLPETVLETSTDLTSTIFYLQFEDNASVTDTFTTVTESLFSTIEYDNVTEITFFDKNNSTNTQPNTIPKRNIRKDCSCNLMYRVCDINCCCDSDCTSTEQTMFTKCDRDALTNVQNDKFCYSLKTRNDGFNLDNLFCLAKTNFPDKRNIIKYDAAKIIKSFKWHETRSMKPVQEFTKKMYRQGDLLWLLRNGSIYYIDLPAPMASGYCTGRIPIKFLKEERVKCNVKLTDLEIFHILSITDEAYIISVTENSSNSTALNCSSLHCTNWSVIVCDDAHCINYNKSLHDPLCTDNSCTDLALKVEYIFYYYESKITNATLKLNTQKVSLNIPFMTQEINVQFVMANKSVDDIIEFSGNPGYISGLPVIVSYSESNHTDDFYNSTFKPKKYLRYPHNKNGICVLSNVTNNFVLFGVNKRIKCRYNHYSIILNNGTGTCENIQSNINHILGLNHNKIAVSPYGNPYDVPDGDWISLQMDKEQSLYGQFNKQKSILHCYNLITRTSSTFSFMDTSTVDTKRVHKIVTAKVDVTFRNVTFIIEDMFTVVTIDTMFIDGSKPIGHQYAGGPHLNIHLPKDFFFPFPSNKSYANIGNMHMILYFWIVAVINK